MKAYSEDLRQEIVDALKRGTPKSEAADLGERPAATASERRRYLERLTGASMSESTVRRLVRRLGHSRKKDPL